MNLTTAPGKGTLIEATLPEEVAAPAVSQRPAPAAADEALPA